MVESGARAADSWRGLNVAGNGCRLALACLLYCAICAWCNKSRWRGPRGRWYAAVAFCAAGWALVLCAGGCAPAQALPKASYSRAWAPLSPEAAAIEQQEVCVGSAVASAGTLGDVLYYRARVLDDQSLVVGYFAFFSEERPWGNNWLTWTMLPALAVDMVYTRAALIAPGLQRILSGKGDVEGFRIVYAMRDDGALDVKRAFADDGTHAPVVLEAHEVLAIDPRRPVLYSRVWSHQLGGKGVKRKEDLAYVRCFGPGQVLPLADDVAREFAIDKRAQPAHVEHVGGVDVEDPRRRVVRASTAGTTVTAEARQVSSPSTARTPKR